MNKKKRLRNKGFWSSNDEWSFKTKEELIYIENITKTKVLGATRNGEVVLEDFEEDKTGQLWKKGEPDAEGYFTLENSNVVKIMTAISKSGLEIKGNITLRWKRT